MYRVSDLCEKMPDFGAESAVTTADFRGIAGPPEGGNDRKRGETPEKRLCGPVRRRPRRPSAKREE